MSSIDFKPTRPFRLVSGSEDNTVAIFEGPPFKFKMVSIWRFFSYIGKFRPFTNTVVLSIVFDTTRTEAFLRALVLMVVLFYLKEQKEPRLANSLIRVLKVRLLILGAYFAWLGVRVAKKSRLLQVTKPSRFGMRKASSLKGGIWTNSQKIFV
jgi:hypothetical protein